MQVDMRRKLMEDPLLLIRKREEETKQEITSNPVKMQRLQQLVSFNDYGKILSETFNFIYVWYKFSQWKNVLHYKTV